jgi:CRISPR type III-B/RAMP module RAMP protein Cmr1
MRKPIRRLYELQDITLSDDEIKKLSRPGKSLEKIDHQQPADVITQVRHYQLITPLYGGGVEANKNDELTPIRGTEIRGQLRFWWRATRGCFTTEELAKFKERYKDKYKDKDADELALSLPIDALREREGEVWGEAHDFRKEGEKTKENEEAYKKKKIDRYKYTVQIHTEVEGKGESPKPFKLEKKSSGKGYDQKSNNNVNVPEYAAFPLQIPREELDDLADLSQSDAEKHLREVRIGVKFKLEISYPKEFEREIKAALWAWETFGGIGARTRRGFGALECTSIENANSKERELPANAASAKTWIQEQANKHIKESGTWPKDVPHLSREFIENQNIKITTRKKGSGAFGYWNNLITKLHDFRQARSGGNSNSQRSRWPEPDTIREITGQKDDKYKDLTFNPLIEKFPRAAFGLPIIFKFKDNQKDLDNPKFDPRQTVLQPYDEGIERFASPLILKPISCQNDTYAGLATILEGVVPEQAALEIKEVKNDKKRLRKVEAQLNEKEYNRLKDKNSAIDTANSQSNQISSNKDIDIRRTFIRYLQ